MSVNNIDIVKKTFNIDIAKLTKEQIGIIRNVLPDEKSEIISFELHDVDVSIANAIRRAVMSEIEVRSLNYEWSDIDTDQRHIIVWELYDRIRFIPLNQDCPDDVVFSLDIINTGEDDLMVMSSDIIASDGKTYFPGDIRIAELEPMHHVTIPMITISSNCNYKTTHAADMITAAFTYKCTDYVGVYYMYEKSIINRMVLASDLEKLLKKHGVKSTTKSGKKPLIIFNKVYEQFHTDISDRYEFIESPEDYLDENEFLRWYQSAEADPNHFALSFETLGNIPPKTMVARALNSMISRLEKIVEDFSYCIDNGLDSYQSVYIMQEGDTVIIGVDESKTIERLMVRHIYKLDKTIPFVASTSEFTVNTHFEIIVVHPEYSKLFIDAANYVADIFREFLKSF